MESTGLNEVALIWLALSAVFFVLEVSLVPGIGFLFAGLAALTLGGLINFGYVGSDSVFEQLAYFFGLLFVWAAILWYPLKNFRDKSKGNEYKNVIGDSAIVSDKSLEKNKSGKVKWSGTIMKAKLYNEDEKDSVKEGEEVYVMDIKGNVLTVTTNIENTKTDDEEEED